MPTELERLLILAGAAIVVAAASLLVRRWARRRAAALSGTASGHLWQALGDQPDGRPVVVAFSTPSCAACRTAQAPALAALEGRLGQDAVRVVHVNVAARPEVARAFGVLTVPSTVVLAPDGAVRAVNYGFAPAERLGAQLATAAA